jgi:zinc protease
MRYSGRMASVLSLSAAMCVTLGILAAGQSVSSDASDRTAPQIVQTKDFPYPIHHRKLPNGLDVLVIPTPEFKDMVTFATLVLAGSRNETESGKTGLAHLFEHVMFRHEFGGKAGGYDEQIRRMGAHNNAFTNFDVTFYHPTTFTTNLIGPIQRPGGSVSGLIELEAARFTGLTVDEKTFRTEAGAVLGEYRRQFANPLLNIVERTSAVTFPDHPYGHTVIGLLEDVENMPDASAAAWEFFRAYYTPNNCALVVAGDVQPAAVFGEVEKRYGAWAPRPTPKIPPASPPGEEKVVHVPWEADVSPRVTISYHTPAVNPESRESAINLILGELLVSRSAPLFQKMRYEKQSVTGLISLGLEQSTDPHLLMVSAELMLDRFRKEGHAYVEDVRADIVGGVEDLKRFSSQPDAARTLRVVQSKMRNDLLASLESTDAIATVFALYYRYNRDPRVFDVLLDSLNALTPADIDAYAGKYFRRERRVVTTFWGPSGPKQAPEARP